MQNLIYDTLKAFVVQGEPFLRRKEETIGKEGGFNSQSSEKIFLPQSSKIICVKYLIFRLN